MRADRQGFDLTVVGPPLEDYGLLNVAACVCVRRPQATAEILSVAVVLLVLPACISLRKEEGEVIR